MFDYRKMIETIVAAGRHRDESEKGLRATLETFLHTDPLVVFSFYTNRIGGTPPYKVKV